MSSNSIATVILAILFCAGTVPRCGAQIEGCGPGAEQLEQANEIFARAEEIGLDPAMVDKVRAMVVEIHGRGSASQEALVEVLRKFSEEISEAHDGAVTALGQLERSLQELPVADGGGEAAAVDPVVLKLEIEAMRVPDVAWRKIAWKTCLLDALQASREQHKPVVLWVFIDRPVDDKRC